MLGSPLQTLATPSVGAVDAVMGSAVRKEIQTQFFRVLVHKTTALTAHKDKSKDEKKTDKKDTVVVSTLFSSVVQFHAQLSLSYVTINSGCTPTTPNNVMLLYRQYYIVILIIPSQ